MNENPENVNALPEEVNDANRDQVAALLGWKETDNGWITPGLDFYCWHTGACYHNTGRDAELARGLAKLREAREKEAR